MLGWACPWDFEGGWFYGESEAENLRGENQPLARNCGPFAGAVCVSAEPARGVRVVCGGRTLSLSCRGSGLGKLGLECWFPLGVILARPSSAPEDEDVAVAPPMQASPGGSRSAFELSLRPGPRPSQRAAL